MEIELFFFNELERDLLTIEAKSLSEENHELVLYLDRMNAREYNFNDLIRQEPWVPKKPMNRRQNKWIVPLPD